MALCSATSSTRHNNDILLPTPRMSHTESRCRPRRRRRHLPSCDDDGTSRGSACVEFDDVFDRTSSAGSLLRAQLDAPQPPFDDTLSRASQSGATAHAAAGRGGSDGGDGNNDNDGDGGWWQRQRQRRW